MIEDSLEIRYAQLTEKIEKLSAKLRRMPPTLVAVTKTFPVSKIEQLYHLGHRDFGENYAQELLSKAMELEASGIKDVRWHFIGHLQTNKIKQLLPYVGTIHTVDSFRAAQELAKRWISLNKEIKLPIFVQVNMDQEATKAGIDPADVPKQLNEIQTLSALKLLGLMCIPKLDRDPRESFSHLRELEMKCRPLTQGMLSMGMSHDFETALEEGATHIRVGRALLGDRRP